MKAFLQVKLIRHNLQEMGCGLVVGGKWGKAFRSMKPCGYLVSGKVVACGSGMCGVGVGVGLVSVGCCG